MSASTELRGRAQRAHFFISYSRSDRIAVDEIVEKLRARNYRLWMDVDEQGTNHLVWGEGFTYDSPGTIWYVKGK